jgi:chromosome segregation ATPase
VLVVAAEEGEEEVEEEEGGEEEPPRLPAPRSPQKGDKGGSVGGPVLAAPLQVQPMQEAWSSLGAAAGAVMTGLRGAREDARRQRAEGLSGAAALRVSESRLTEGGARQEGLSRELQAAMGHGRSLGDQLVVTRARAAALDTELETARGELTRLSGVEGELSDVRLYYQEAVERLSRLQSAHDSLQTELAATGDRLQGELTATQSAAVEASEAHAAEHDLLSDRVATLEGEARRSAGVLSEYRLQLASLSKGVGQMAEACRLLYRGFSPLHARYSELKAQKAYLSREHGKYITLQGETEHLMAALTGTRARYSRREGRRTRASGKALFRVSICCVLAAHRMQRGGREGGFGKGVASTAPSRQQLFLLPERAVSVDASLPVCDVTSPTSSGKSLLRLLEHLTPDHAFGHSLTSGLIPPLHLARSNRKGLGGEQGEQGAVAVIRRISLQLATRVGELERSEATLYQQFNKAQTDLTQSHQRADTLNNSYQVSSATAVRLESRVAELMNETMTMVEPEQLERAVDEVETLQQEAEELRGETAEQREVARRLQVSLTAVTGDLQSARATAQEQAQELMSLKGYAQRKTAELESLKQQSRETAAQLQAARRAVDGAAVTSNATGTRLQATERDLSEERSHLQRSQEENLVLEGKLHRMDSERLELEVTLNEKSRELYKVRQMLSTILPDDEGYPVYDEEPVA